MTNEQKETAQELSGEKNLFTVCGSCGTKVKAHNFCTQCGTKFEELVFCTSCNLMVKKRNFCTRCGNKLTTAHACH